MGSAPHQAAADQAALTRLTDDPEQSRRMFSTLEAEERYPEDYVWGGISDARALIAL